jgi:hypothetical protein
MANEAGTEAPPKYRTKPDRFAWRQLVKQMVTVRARIVQEMIQPGELGDAVAVGHLAAAINAVVGDDLDRRADSIPPKKLAEYVDETRKRVRAVVPEAVPENVEDGRFALDEMSRGGLDGYEADYVAVLNKKVVGSGADEQELRSRLAKELGVDPARLFVVYKGPLM